MDIKKFSEVCGSFWQKYLKNVEDHIRDGSVGVSSNITNPAWLFPRYLTCSKTDKFLIMELAGTQRTFRGLKLQHSTKPINLDSYLGQFEFEKITDGLINSVNVTDFGVRAAGFSKPGAIEEADRRFPGFSRIVKSNLVRFSDGEGPLITLGPDANFFSIEDSVLFNSYRRAVRTRHISYLLIVQLHRKPEELADYLQREIGSPVPATARGVQTVESGAADIIMQAAQFASFFLRPNGEVKIGDYLRQHDGILRAALSSNRIIYEPDLKWQPGTPSCGDISINPDLLVQRSDGSYDIYDLKLPLLGKKVTKGDRRRRRFVESVNEGAAQLAHYEEYFTYPENAAHALSKYGVRVDSPKSVLVVGNRENITDQHVDEALRTYRNLEIINYDAIVRLFMANTLNDAG